MSNSGSPQSRKAIETLLGLTQLAYDGDVAHSLIANIRSLRAEDWTAVLVGGGRSIAAILEHVAWAKWMYEDYAFGAASMRGDEPPLVPEDGAPSRPPDELLTWLENGHRRWLTSLSELSDDRELARDRLTNWGEWLPTGTIIEIMIAHDLYHAGEINHLLALLQGTDRWPY